jgi:hypothetical protein
MVQNHQNADKLKHRKNDAKGSPVAKQHSPDNSEKKSRMLEQVGRIGSFPHPYSARISVLSDRKHQGILK